MDAISSISDFSIRIDPDASWRFCIEPSTHYQPTPLEATFVQRIEAIMSRLDKGEGLDKALEEDCFAARERCVRKIKEGAQSFIAELSANGKRDALAQDLLLSSYRIEGFYEEWIARIKLIPFTVSVITKDYSADPKKPDLIAVDVKIDARDVKIPFERQQFKVKVDTAATVIKAVFAEHESSIWSWLNEKLLHKPSRSKILQKKRDEYIQGLAGIARVGLMNQDPSQVAFAELALKGFQEEFVSREAGPVKNRYIQRLGAFALFAAILLIIGYTASTYWGQPFFYKFRNFFLLAAGAAVGTWLSFSIRRVILSFADLAELEEDHLNPGVRVLFVIGLTVVAGLLLWTGAISIGIGDFQSDFELSGTHAMLIGLLSGIAERALATSVGQRALDYAAGIGGAKVTR